MKFFFIVLPILLDPFVFLAFGDSTQFSLNLTLSRLLYLISGLCFFTPFISSPLNRPLKLLLAAYGRKVLTLVTFFYLFGFISFIINQFFYSSFKPSINSFFPLLDFLFRVSFIAYAASLFTFEIRLHNLFSLFLKINSISMLVGFVAFIYTLIFPSSSLLQRQISYYFSSDTISSIGLRFSGLYGEPRDAVPAILLLAFVVFLYRDFLSRDSSRFNYSVRRPVGFILFFCLVFTVSSSLILTPLLCGLLLIIYSFILLLLRKSFLKLKSFFFYIFLFCFVFSYLIFSTPFLTFIGFERLQIYLDSLTELFIYGDLFLSGTSNLYPILSGQLPDLSIFFTIKNELLTSNLGVLQFVIGHGPFSLLAHSQVFSVRSGMSIGLPFVDLLRIIFEYGLIGLSFFIYIIFLLYRRFLSYFHSVGFNLSKTTSLLFWLLVSASLSHKTFCIYSAIFFMSSVFFYLFITPFSQRSCCIAQTNNSFFYLRSIKP